MQRLLPVDLTSINPSQRLRSPFADNWFGTDRFGRDLYSSYRSALWLGFTILAVSAPARADEGAVSFWLPGQFASFAAVPGAPGWSVPLAYYHASAEASASKDFIVGGNLVAGLDVKADLVFFAPSYTFTQPLLGGQAAVTLAWPAGQVRVTAHAAVTGPRGNQIPGSRADTTSGGGDLYPQGSMRGVDTRISMLQRATSSR